MKKKKIGVSIFIIGLLLTTSIASVNAVHCCPPPIDTDVFDMELSEVHYALPTADVYVDDDAPPEWYDETHVKTINEGMEVAEDGDTIYVFNGTYYENLIIDKSIDLIGENRKGTIIAASGIRPIIDIDSSFITIKGFTIENASQDSITRGIKIIGENYHLMNIHISECIVRHHFRAILIYNVSNISITNCHIYNNTCESINIYSSDKNIYNSDNIMINKCTIHDNGIDIGGGFIVSGGIDIYSQGFRHSNISITECNIYDNIGVGIWLEGADNIDVSQTTIYNNTWTGIYLLKVKDGEIYQNNLYGHSLNGIHVAYSFSNINIYENTISNNGNGEKFDGGILLGVSNYIIVYNNTIISNNGDGLFLGYSCNNIITMNNITNNNCGIEIDEYSTDNSIYYNNFKNNSGILIGGNAKDKGSNIWDDGDAMGNYWDDYIGIDFNGDGIGDRPYIIPPILSGNKDRYPLMGPWPDPYPYSNNLASQNSKNQQSTPQSHPLPNQQSSSQQPSTIFNNPSGQAMKAVKISQTTNR